MKVTIGKYKNWVGPYQLANALCFWVKEVPDEYGIYSKPRWVHKFGEWLDRGSISPTPKKGDIERWSDEQPVTMLSKFLTWIHTFREQKIEVRIDKWDTWSMDHTLAHIILPMLKQLQASKHGAPHVDDKDVPAELRSTAALPKENEWHTDDNHFKRWDWVMGEMIFAFESKLNDWEEQFHTGTHDIQWVCLENGNHQMIKGDRDTHKYDLKGATAYQKRISNGFKLFGKYYENLWD